MVFEPGSDRRRIVFDVETAPLEDAAEYLIEPVEAPANYRDQAKIAAFISEKKAKQVAECALDYDLCRIVAIGILLEGREPDVALAGFQSERSLLEMFWNQAHDRHLIGFNVLSFDLPVLLRRSLYLGIKAPSISIDRYRHPDVTDLARVLSFDKPTPDHSLDFYAKRFGIDVPDTMSGADIGKAVIEGRWDDVRNHCLADVKKTAAVAEKCGLFKVAAEVF